MQSSSLTPAAQTLAAQLDALDAQSGAHAQGPMFHVESIGGTFYFAYEQLRNVAEYREHHLLLRSAIERYFRRYVRLDRFSPVGAEMVTELTQAGYLKNDSIPASHIRHIDDLLSRYGGLMSTIQQVGRVSRKTATGWMLQIASVQVEDLLSPNKRLPVFMSFTYDHYLGAIDREQFRDSGLQFNDDDYHLALYTAVQRALFKSDLATTRYYCLAASLPGLNEQTVEHFVRVNRLIDQHYQSPLSNRIFRLVNRYAAPMRILRELITENAASPATLTDKGTAIAKVRRICSQQYGLMEKRLSSRITKTILFILVTKVLLGVSIEVPYDILTLGAIAWMPLMLNIMFPVLYMMLLSFRISAPERHNTELIAAFTERILYQQDGEPIRYRAKKRVTSSSLSTAFTLVYGIGFTVSFGLLTWILYKLNFNIVNGFIFFIFLSAVSFLGFRLRQSARELAMLDERQNLLQTLTDFLSTPFVRVGYWLSDRYAKLNLVTRILDVAIEMPLKTSLRLVQQWVGFLRDKQEEL